MPIIHNDVCYWPVPKCACTSVKTFFATNSSPEPLDLQETNVHQLPGYSSKPFVLSTYENVTAGVHSAAIRDPVKRLLSAYVNRVWVKKELIKNRARAPKDFHYTPDPSTFFRNLAKAQSVSQSVLHHTNPHFEFLGGTLDRYHLIGQVEDLERYFETLRTSHGFLGPSPRRQVSNSQARLALSDLDRPAQIALLDYCEADYVLLRDYYQPPVIKSAVSTFVPRLARKSKRALSKLVKGHRKGAR